MTRSIALRRPLHRGHLKVLPIQDISVKRRPGQGSALTLYNPQLWISRIEEISCSSCTSANRATPSKFGASS